MTDPEWVARYRAYQRDYQKKWLRTHPAKREHHRELVKEWRREHPRKFRASQRAWRKNNPDKVRQMRQRWYAKHGREWYQKHRVKRRKQARRTYRRERRHNLLQQRARRRRYYWKNRERINKKRRHKRLQNPEFYKHLERRRYRKHRIRRIVSQRNIQARRAGAKGQITPEQWRRLLRRHRFLCFYCGAKLVPANRTLDHKLPLSRGGTNTIDNVVPACRPCNQRKMSLTAREFLTEQRRGPRNFQ